MSFKYSAAGFKQDMEKLFTLFTTPATQSDEKSSVAMSLRFKRFCGFWKEMRFSFVFRFRQSDRELRELIDEIYLEVLPQLCCEHPLERRVFALYMLYSLYVKQPKVCQKIRLNFQFLEQIRELIQKCKELEQMDVCFIWYKLLSLGAIDLVHVSRLMGPHYIRNSRVSNEGLTETDFIIDEFKTSIYPPISELSHIHEKYRTIKESLVDKNPEIGKECDKISDNVFELIKTKADNLHKQFLSNHLSDQTIAEESDDSEDRQIDIGIKRRRLKEKAQTFGVKSSEQQIDNQSNQRKSSRGRPKQAKLTDIM